MSRLLLKAQATLLTIFNDAFYDNIDSNRTVDTDFTKSKLKPPPQDGKYEYIVVGSGPGGGPLAARLAIAGHKVLLIDAGGDYGDTNGYKVPMLWCIAAEYAPMKWGYFINNFQTLERAQQDTKFTWETPSGEYHIGCSPPEGSKPLDILYLRAGTLGGCAAHNALISVAPHDSD